MGLARHVRVGARAAALALVGLLLAGAGLGQLPQDDPDVTFPTTDGVVYALEVIGDTLYVGGKFNAIGGVARRNLAAIDLTSNTVTDWHPKPNREVWQIAPGPTADTVYIAGKFTKLRKNLRARVAEVEVSGRGEPTAFAPTIDGLRAQAVLHHAGTVYVGGRFDGAEGVSRPWLLAFDTAGNLLPWDPDVDNSVWDLELGPDGSIWAAGKFTAVGGYWRVGTVALDPVTAVPTSWRPTIPIPAFDLAFNDAGRLYVAAAGSGGSVLGYEDPRLSSTANLLFRFRGNGDMQAVDVDGNTVYAGGHPSLVWGGAQDLSKTFALDGTTGQLLAWDGQNFGGKGAWELVVDSRGLFMGGDFTRVEGDDLPGLARFAP